MTRERRVKQRNDPSTQWPDDELLPSPPQRELRPRRRPGKKPAGSSNQAPLAREPRRAPYILQSSPNPPPTRANPQRWGIAYDICPRTLPRLQAEFAPDQRRYNSFPRLGRPQRVEGFAVELARNYSGQEVALRDARQEDVYRLQKCEGPERHFWCQLHHDFYTSIVLKGSEAPIVPCKYVD